MGMNEELVLRNNLKQIRKSRKLSQDELAKIVGVSRNTISKMQPFHKNSVLYSYRED